MIKYETELREMIVALVPLTVPIREVDIDTDFRMLGMDSLAFINLVTKIEDKFEIIFPDEKLIMEEASTIQKLSAIIVECKME
ncbi:acyl carrier protein [Paenibacillus motobuensis]|uniref:acyl carrier protein n=1 Tax=Paenibacillus TaxID=44249 RepID=UPI00203A85B3|nr:MULTISPECIES: acyl carrier protein [Paenibacillus]MCM3038994.1 acyl carrier protein [Paenibacillus lutimineralis]MCM3646098.1 acyl carrier protein [Paenibacillus motobuensis]